MRAHMVQHTARLVMRRDLALSRESAGIHHLAAASLPAVINEAPTQNATSESPAKITSPARGPVNDDVNMLDAATTELVTAAQKDEPSSEAAPVATTEEPAAESNAPLVDDELQLASSMPNQQPFDTSLQIDTLPSANNTEVAAAEDEDQAPNTGTFSNTNDLDSLFGGPLSAGIGDAPTFDIDPNNNDDFDFDEFASSLGNTGADNDNLSSLLPGLEDYANAQPTGDGEIDFDAIFSLPNQGDGDQTGLLHPDSTFDDLADLLDFNGNTFGGDGGEGENDNQEFDFSNQ